MSSSAPIPTVGIPVPLPQRVVARRTPAPAAPARWWIAPILAVAFWWTPGSALAKPAVPGEADDVLFVRAGAPAPPPEVTVVATSDGGIELEFTLPSLELSDVREKGRACHSLDIPGGGSARGPGGAEIPTYGRLVHVPPGAVARVAARVVESVERTGVRLRPFTAGEDDDGEGGTTTPAGSDLDPPEPVRLGPTAVLRGLRVAPLIFQPVLYEPDREAVRVATRMRVTISFRPEAAGDRDRPADRPFAPSFDSLYRHLLVNYDQARAGREVRPGSWVLICPDDAAVVSRLQPLLEWRMRQGTPAWLATTAETGTTRESILAWLQNAYDTWETPPEYVVLAGDAQGTYVIPTWLEGVSGHQGEGDHPYTQLDGTDVLSDVHIGRLSFGSLTDLEVIVAKIVNYESAPEPSDPGWFRRACLIADPGSQAGWSSRMLQLLIYDRLRSIGYAEIDTVFYPPLISDMATAMNRGDTVVCYRGTYRMSGWTNGQTYALTNSWKLPFLVALTCETGDFYYEPTGLSEGFLRANTGLNRPKGAIGAIGTATPATHTRYNNCFTFGIMHGLLYEGQTTLGSALTRGKLEMYVNYEAVEPENVFLWSHWTNLMGDPAVACWTGVPGPITVGHPASIPVGTNSVAITVEREGLPAESALVCLWDGAGAQFTARTDDSGTAELPVVAAAPGELLLTVTGPNLHPYLASIAVAGADSAFIGLESTAVDDDGTGESQGNGDGEPNPGETIELRVALHNFGGQPAQSVIASLVSADPYVTVTDGEESFGDLAPGASAWCLDDFGFTLSPACPAGRTLRFGLEVQAPPDHSLLELTVVAPDLVATQTAVSDPGGNGRLDPGETAGLTVTLQNQGGLGASSVTGTLASFSPWVEVLSGAGDFGEIPAGQSGTNAAPFTLAADGGAFPGHQARLRLTTASNGGMADTTEFLLTVGQAGTADPTGPDAHGYYVLDDTDTAYPGVPNYDWIELDPASGGDGVELAVGDYGLQMDVSVAVELPFTFTMYGESHREATICSNGWLSLGATSDAEYRNWTIPGAGAPANLLAVFWDDLYQEPDSKILYKHDAAGHRWIVEWSRMRNAWADEVETFEAILYDPTWHPTASGDGIIVYQYQTVANTDQTDGFATVGIENADQSAGLLYTYFNLYPPGSAPLAAGRALRIEPVLAPARCRIEGTVTNASAGGAPAAGVEVRALGAPGASWTDADGRYSRYVPEGTYTVVAASADFQPDSLNGVVATPAQPAVADFSLSDIAGPHISDVTREGHSPSGGPYAIDAEVDDPSGVAEVRLGWRVGGDPWNDTPMTFSDGAYHAALPGATAGQRVDYYVSARDSVGWTRTDPAGAPDSTYALWATLLVYSWEMEDPASPGWLLGVPGDDATAGIWVREDPAGLWTISGWPIKPPDDHTPTPGRKCFVTGSGADLISNGCTTVQSPFFDLSGGAGAFVSYWRFFSELFADHLDDALSVLVSSDGGTSWLPLEILPTAAPSWQRSDLSLDGVIDLTGTVAFRFRACERGNLSFVAAALDDFSLEILPPGPEDVPELRAETFPLALDPPRPNPQRPSAAAIRFSLDRPRQVRLDVYDVAGRLVRRVLDEPRAAGPQTATWDGRDERGSAVGAGVWLLRLDAGGERLVQRIVRVH